MSTPGADTEQRPTKDRAIASKTIAALAVALLLIAFGISNKGDVPVDWLVGTTQTPLIVVIAVSAGLGVLLGAFAGQRRGKRRALKGGRRSPAGPS
jgi:uncharacterized integral membrane protein